MECFDVIKIAFFFFEYLTKHKKFKYEVYGSVVSFYWKIYRRKLRFFVLPVRALYTLNNLVLYIFELIIFLSNVWLIVIQETFEGWTYQNE